MATAEPAAPPAASPKTAKPGADPAAAAASQDGALTVAALANKYRAEFEQTFEAFRARALKLQADAPQLIQETQANVEPYKQDFITTVQATGDVTTPPGVILSTLSWATVLVLFSTVASFASGYLFAPILGLAIGGAGALVLALGALPAYSYYTLNQDIAASASDVTIRFRLLAAAVIQGLLVGFILQNSYLSGAPIASLILGIAAAAYPFAAEKFGGNRQMLLGASVGSAVGVTLVLGLLSGYLTLPYLLLSALYGGVTAITLQYMYKNVTAETAPTYLYQLALLVSFAAARLVVHLVFGMGPEAYAQYKQGATATQQNRRKRDIIGGEGALQSTPKLGVDYTQKQVELVARIRTCKDFYEILQVDKNASEDDIKRAYKKLALQLHPDKCRAPHSTEAFSALGSAYDVLSNEEKRHRYDMYGNEEAAPARQRQHHHPRHGDGYFQYDYSHGFQSDFTPEEIFNMFFGGVFPDEVMRRQRNQQFRRHFRPRPEEEEEEGVEAENGGGRYMLIIILVAIFMSYIAPFLNSLSAPPFSLRQNSDYPIRRDTANLRVPYFVQRDFMEHYSTEIRKIDKKVEEDYTYQLRVECYKEQQQ
ncbi:unnamed protein product, partial [Mesorhabditis spiculigera]